VPDDKLMTTGQVARELRLSHRSLNRWAEQGVIRPAVVTPGGRRLWDLEDLRRQIRDMSSASGGGSNL
jgi:DNA-binding transcriptional MerR regulator